MSGRISTRLARSLLIISLMSLGLLGVQGQDDPVSRFLAGQLRAPEVQMAEEAAGFLATHPPTMSWIDKLEFRTETGNFDLRQQEYLLRLSPNSIRARNRQSDLVGVLQTQYDLQTRETVHEALVAGYERLIDLAMLDRETALVEQALEVDQQHLAVLGQIGQVDGADLKNLMQVEEDRQQRLSRLQELRSARQILQRPLMSSVSLPTSQELESFLWITDRQMMDMLSTGTGWSTPQMLKAQSRLEAVVLEQQVERAERQKVLDFVQSRYQQDPKDPFREEFSISMGFNIPYARAGNIKRQELALEQLESEQKISLLQQQTLDRLSALRMELELLLQQKTMQEEQWASSFLQKMESGTLPGLTAEPLLILEARKARIKSDLRILEIDKKILEVYVRWLDLSGKISEPPLVNYLHFLKPIF